MAGTDAIYDALFRKYRVHRADTLEELFDFAKALAYLPKPKGRKLMITTSSGGAAILAIDEAEKHGLTVPEPNPILKERLREMLPAHCAVGNPVDLTGDAISAPDLYKQVMDKTREEYDTQVVIFGDPIPGASQQVTPGASELVVFLGGAEVEREERQKFYEAGIPVFPTPERGIAALAQFFRFEPRPAPAPGRPPVAVPEGLQSAPAPGSRRPDHQSRDSRRRRPPGPGGRAGRGTGPAVRLPGGHENRLTPAGPQNRHGRGLPGAGK